MSCSVLQNSWLSATGKTPTPPPPSSTGAKIEYAFEGADAPVSVDSSKILLTIATGSPPSSTAVTVTNENTVSVDYTIVTTCSIQTGLNPDSKGVLIQAEADGTNLGSAIMNFSSTTEPQVQNACCFKTVSRRTLATGDSFIFSLSAGLANGGTSTTGTADTVNFVSMYILSNPTPA